MAIIASSSGTLTVPAEDEVRWIMDSAALEFRSASEAQALVPPSEQINPSWQVPIRP